MIDYFTLALTHGLLALALWRMLFRDDLDAEVPKLPLSGERRAELDEADGDA